MPVEQVLVELVPVALPVVEEWPVLHTVLVVQRAVLAVALAVVALVEQNCESVQRAVDCHQINYSQQEPHQTCVYNCVCHHHCRPLW